MKLKTRHRLLLRKYGYHAVYVIGPADVVRYQTDEQHDRLLELLARIEEGAHNGGPLDWEDYVTEEWPIRIGTTGDFSDALVNQADGWDKTHQITLLSRVWCESADQSHFLSRDLMRSMGRVIRKSWIDAKHPIDRDMFDQNVKWIAHDNAIRGLTDLELVCELEAIDARRYARVTGGQNAA